jgi:hypothetical protein
MPLVQLMREALVLAKTRDVDVFNALDVMENLTFLPDLKFGPGDGHLQVRMGDLTGAFGWGRSGHCWLG